jgi:hypothetical protein
MSQSVTSTKSLKATTALSPGQTYTVSPSDVAITGSSGNETVILADSTLAVTLSSSIENLNLSKGIFNYWFNPNGAGGAYLFSNTTGLLANISSSTLGVHVNFGDKSALTLSANAQGYAQIHYDKAQLIPNISVTLPNGDITLWGSTGKETVNIPAGISHVNCDSAVDVINLGVSYDPSLLSLSLGSVSISDAAHNKILDWAVNTVGSHSLSFSNASGAISINSNGQDVFTLTDLQLNNSQTYTSTLSNLNLYGTSGNETVVLGSGVHMDTIDSKIEKVVLPSALSKYTWTTQGSTLTLFDASNTQVALINVVRASTGTVLQFADQTLNAIISSSGVNVFTNSGQVVKSGTTIAPTTTSTAVSNASPSTPSSTNAASHFQYTLDFSAFSGYTSQQTAVQTCLTAALNKIGAFFNARGSLDIQVIPENTSANVLAEASGALVSVPANVSTAHSAAYTTAFLAESQTGLDANGTQADAKVYINMSDWSLFNTNPSVLPTKSQYDLTTVLTHELLHALGFDGMYPSASSGQTTYDTYIKMQNGLPYFTGPKAQALYGGPVPLDPASAGVGSAYYHLKVPSDLMSDALSAGSVRAISALDIAIMQDLGAPVLVGVASA